MRILLALLISFVFLVSCGGERTVKSIYRVSGQDTLSLQLFDQYGRLYFDKISQFGFDWDMGPITWVKYIEYDGHVRVAEYHAHSNSGLKKTNFHYAQNLNDGTKYSMRLSRDLGMYSSEFRTNGQNELRSLYKMNSPFYLIQLFDSLMVNATYNLDSAIVMNYNKHREYTDSSGFLTREFWKSPGTTDFLIEKYDRSGRVIRVLKDGVKYDMTSDLQFSYDSVGCLTQEDWFLENEDVPSQSVVYNYDQAGRLLTKKIWYSGKQSKAISYFYDSNRITKELITTFSKNDADSLVEVVYQYQYHD